MMGDIRDRLRFTADDRSPTGSLRRLNSAISTSCFSTSSNNSSRRSFYTTPTTDNCPDVISHPRKLNRSASCFDNHSSNYRRGSLFDASTRKLFPDPVCNGQQSSDRRRNTTFAVGKAWMSGTRKSGTRRGNNDDTTLAEKGDDDGCDVCHVENQNSTSRATDSNSDVTLMSPDEVWSVFSDHVRSVPIDGAVDFTIRRFARICSPQFQQVVDDITAETEAAEHVPPPLPPSADRRRSCRRWRRAYSCASSVSTMANMASRYSRSRPSVTETVIEEPVTSSTEPRSRGWKILRRLLDKERQARKMVPGYQPWSILRRGRGSTSATNSWETRWSLYERYVNGTDSWENGLSESGNDRLRSLQQIKRTTQRQRHLSVTTSTTVTSRQRAMSARPTTSHQNGVTHPQSATVCRTIKSAMPTLCTRRVNTP